MPELALQCNRRSRKQIRPGQRDEERNAFVYGAVLIEQATLEELVPQLESLKVTGMLLRRTLQCACGMRLSAPHSQDPHSEGAARVVVALGTDLWEAQSRHCAEGQQVSQHEEQGS